MQVPNRDSGLSHAEMIYLREKCKRTIRAWWRERRKNCFTGCEWLDQLCERFAMVRELARDKQSMIMKLKKKV